MSAPALAVAAEAAPSVRRDLSADGFEIVHLEAPEALEAAFAPQVGMACCSLKQGDAELLDGRFGLAAYAGCGVAMGMSLMHPWADRLSSWQYTACGTTVRLPISPLLHTDGWGLPVNGVQSCGDRWKLEHSGATGESAWLEALLPFEDPKQLALFPFPHLLRLRAEVAAGSLSVAVEMEATGRIAVPVCFGLRIYLRRESADGEATLVLPARRRLMTDERLLPTGSGQSTEMTAATLGIEPVSEVFALGKDRRLSLVAGTRREEIELLDGFQFARVGAVGRERHVMVEALTAEPDALSRGRFAVATQGRPYRAKLRLSADVLDTSLRQLSVV